MEDSFTPTRMPLFLRDNALPVYFFGYLNWEKYARQSNSSFSRGGRCENDLNNPAGRYRKYKIKHKNPNPEGVQQNCCGRLRDAYK
jgi:hypothetical protein